MASMTDGRLDVYGYPPSPWHEWGWFSWQDSWSWFDLFVGFMLQVVIPGMLLTFLMVAPFLIIFMLGRVLLSLVFGV